MAITLTWREGANPSIMSIVPLAYVEMFLRTGDRYILHHAVERLLVCRRQHVLHDGKRHMPGSGYLCCPKVPLPSYPLPVHSSALSIPWTVLDVGNTFVHHLLEP